MASKIEIINRAITKLGAARITSLTDDVKQARTMSALWDMVLDEELRRNNWNFAIKRVAIAALVSVPAFGFSYEYQLPSDYLKAVMVGDYYAGCATPESVVTGPTALYQIEGGKILTDYGSPLNLRYVARITDTTLWDALFIDAIACKLAFEACEEITQSNSKQQSIMMQYRTALMSAVQCDAVENPPEQVADDSWVLAREF